MATKMEIQEKLQIMRAKYSEKYAALKADEAVRQRAASEKKQYVINCHKYRMNELDDQRRELVADHSRMMKEICEAEHAAQELYAKAVLELKKAENEEINQITKED